MITVHHLEQSRSTRILWLLEELGLSYNMVTHQRDPQTRLAPASLQKIHPLAKAPVIVEDNVTLAESGAAMEYILDKVPATLLRPPRNTPEYYWYLEWLHFAEGSLALPVISSLMMSMEKRSGDQPMDGYIAKEIALDFGYIESTLATRNYFAGEVFTAADIIMSVILAIADTLGLITEKPATLAYLQKVQSRAAYIKAKSYG